MLARFRAADFMELTEDAQPIQELDIGLMLQMLDYMGVAVFLDGTEVEYHTEER